MIHVLRRYSIMIQIIMNVVSIMLAANMSAITLLVVITVIVVKDTSFMQTKLVVKVRTLKNTTVI